MKISSVVVPCAFASALLLSARLPGDAVAFSPAAESSLAKSFKTKGGLSLDDMVVFVNGEEQDPAMMGMPAEFTVDFGYEVGITDTFARVSDGKPTDFTRAYGEARIWSETSDGESTEDGLDDLTGKTARFVWNEEEGEYTRTFVDDEEADAEPLAYNAVDMDLRILLPSGEVEEGDEWVVKGMPVFLVLMPGIDLEAAMADSNSEFFEDIPEGVADALTKALEGVEAVCTYGGSADQDGATVGVIQFVCEIDESVMLDPSVMGGDESGMDMEGGGLEILVELEIKGECLWNVDAGHFSSFETEGAGTINVEMTMSVPDMFELEGSAELALELTHSFTASME